MAERDRTMSEEAKEEEKEVATPGDRDTPEPKGERKRGGGMHMTKEHEKRKRGGGLDGAKEHKVHMPEKHHHGRKRGGKVPGMEAKSRPDRRARGGGTSDLSPMTAAGKMSVPDYESKDSVPNGGGRGEDKKAYGGGSHRRPG